MSPEANAPQPNPAADVSDAIDKKVGEVRIDGLDMSFGELLSLHENQELIIQPEYQRLFRWSPEQQSRLIESVLLSLPIPQFFVIENDDGKLELIDGLQRISSIIHFIEPQLFEANRTPELAEVALAEGVAPVEAAEIEEDEAAEAVISSVDTNPLRLEGCDIVLELNGKLYSDLPLALRLRLKRSAVRMTLIKRQSNPMLRYQMFKRLNTGGSSLSSQELRNCTARIIGEDGVRFYAFLVDCANSEAFRATTKLIAPSERAQKQDEELVLRFFALKNWRHKFKNNISDFLTDYLEAVTVKNEQVFDYDSERRIFDRVFRLLNDALGSDAFLRYRDGHFFGSVAPTFYEGITMGVLPRLDEVELRGRGHLGRVLTEVRQTPDFKRNTGPGANTRPRLSGRIGAVETAIGTMLNELPR